MKIELNKHLQDKIQKSLEQIYGVGNVGTMSQEAYDDHMNSLPKPKIDAAYLEGDFIDI